MWLIVKKEFPVQDLTHIVVHAPGGLVKVTPFMNERYNLGSILTVVRFEPGVGSLNATSELCLNLSLFLLFQLFCHPEDVRPS